MIHDAGLFMLGWLAFDALVVAVWMIAVELTNSFGREPRTHHRAAAPRSGGEGPTPLTPPSRPNISRRARV